MIRLRVLGALAASLVCGVATPAGAQWTSIAFEANSWGTPLGSWMVFAPGAAGSWREVAREDGAAPADYTIAWHDLPEDAAHWRALAATLAELPLPAPDYDDCEQQITDQPYGTIRLSRGSTTTEIAWNAGCLDDGYQAFMTVLRRADDLVAGWGKSAPVLRIETYRDGQLVGTRSPDDG